MSLLIAKVSEYAAGDRKTFGKNYVNGNWNIRKMEIAFEHTYWNIAAFVFYFAYIERKNVAICTTLLFSR